MSKIATMKAVPPSSSETLARCYLLNLGMQQSGNPELIAAGHKLQTLMPRMILRALSMKGKKAMKEMRDRCIRYLDGDWAALIDECPSPIGAAQRGSMASEAEDRRSTMPRLHPENHATRCGYIPILTQVGLLMTTARYA